MLLNSNDRLPKDLSHVYKYKKKQPSEPGDVLYRIKRALPGYVSYLAACEMSESFSEYLLYEPILRVMTARKYSVKCEAVCPGIQQPKTGDKKRLDFVARGDQLVFAIEVKWVKTATPDITSDIEKLTACLKAERAWRAFLLLFGTKSCIENFQPPDARLKEKGKIRIADLGRTKFGCRIYELAKQAATRMVNPRGHGFPNGQRQRSIKEKNHVHKSHQSSN